MTKTPDVPPVRRVTGSGQWSDIPADPRESFAAPSGHAGPPSANATSIAGARRGEQVRILRARQALAERNASISAVGASGQQGNHEMIVLARQALEDLAAGIERLEALEGHELTEKYAPGVA
jgi:hypothetical protein